MGEQRTDRLSTFSDVTLKIDDKYLSVSGFVMMQDINAIPTIKISCSPILYSKKPKESDNIVALDFTDFVKYHNQLKALCSKYPSGGRYTQGKMDSVIKIPFDDTRIYGSELTEREKFLFKNHKVREIK